MATGSQWLQYVRLRSEGWSRTGACRETGIDRQTARKFEAGDPTSQGLKWLERRRRGLELAKAAQLEEGPLPAPVGDESPKRAIRPPAPPVVDLRCPRCAGDKATVTNGLARCAACSARYVVPDDPSRRTA